MADSAVDNCLISDMLGNCLPKRGNRRKFCGYRYVPSESDEADTLKDKFWRNLEQGKLNFLNTEDMYTRVKRPGKLSEVDCFIISSQDQHMVKSDTAPVTCTQSSVPLSSAASDASPPPSSGYESSSIPSIGSVSVNDSPTESDQHVAGVCELFTNVAQSEVSLLTRKRKSSSSCVWHQSKCRRHQTAPRNVSYRKKTNSKFFRYVDASSEEADTLKDKFWRDLELGNVSAITTTDLYSSVKVSRRTRQLSFSSVRNFDQAKNSNRIPATSKESRVSNILDDTDVFRVRCFEADVSSCNRKHCASTLGQPSDYYISEEMASVADCKLLSPCSVSVERLPFSVDDVDQLVAGNIDMCSNVVAEKVSKLTTDNHSNVHSDVLVSMDCKRRWHNGTCAASLRHLNKHTNRVKRIPGSNTRLQLVHFSSLDINRSLSLCHVPLSFASVCQQHVICGWLEDDVVAKAGSLRDAVVNNNVTAVRHLLTAETNHSTVRPLPPEDDKMTLVMLAARHGADRVIELLVNGGFDVNAQRPDGITALMIACRMGLMNVVRVLLDCGANTELCTNCGETALLKAVRSGSLDIVSLLLSCGANFAATSYRGITAAMLACRAHRWDIFVVINNHIRRLSRTFMEQINSVIGCFADIQFALFPLQCFPLGTSRQFCVTFGIHHKQLFQERQTLLFIGHTFVGYDCATCRLHGSCAVTDVYLNNTKLQQLSHDGNFIMSFEQLYDGQNELVLHVDCDPSSKMTLIVCAYYIKCKSQLMSSY